ncbi:sulfite exporter TauE/SafE family protein [Clostridium sp. D2Q-11]|uniref:Probable membrane transporter protein n=1 Tax=Anaeromonas frigoriresistens TaxID=2683708 RepID=A0A942UW15_9FIRM|nr:sulfite exporter TauE/SafE family protein [Anaeromonas frigoriresistens]MBS4539638.1 sulfite exporter TauE/SafE family protein [Anaeromonas frigoriresistens]
MKRTLSLVVIGLITGLVNGLFGAGGGMLIVPSLIYIIHLEEHKAHATAITVILPLCITSTYIYFRNDLINFNIALFVAIGSTIGGYIGARLLKHVPNKILRKAFSILIIYISLRMIIV